MGSGALGGLFGLPKVIPRCWRAVTALLAASVLLEIERQKNQAREEQVADLLAEVEWLRAHLEREDKKRSR